MSKVLGNIFVLLQAFLKFQELKNGLRRRKFLEVYQYHNIGYLQLNEETNNV